MVKTLNGIYKKLSQKSKIVIVVFFALIFVLGSLNVNMYGINYDVYSEDFILLTNLKSYANLISPEKASEIYEFEKLPDMREYKERDHGKALYYPIGFLKVLIKPESDTYATCFRLYTFIINYMGLIFLYLLAKLLTKRRSFSLLAVSLYWLSPRILADSFYNEKDMVFASLVILTSYFAIKTLENPNKYIYSVIFGICCAFSCNARVLGLAVAFFALCIYVFRVFKSKTYNKFKSWLPIIITLATFVVVFVAITPGSWGGLVDYFIYTLGNSANFTRWNGTVYYLNEYYTVNENPLPWHYLPVMVFMTTPPLITVLILAGIVAIVFMLIKKDFSKELSYLIMISFSCLFPFVFAILSGSRVYNGWRHFFFIYPALILIAVFGVKYLISKKKTSVKIATKATVFLALVVGVIQLFTVFPYGYAYYNFSQDSFEGDYWNVASYECITKLLDSTEDEITIYHSDRNSGAGLQYASWFLPNKDYLRFKIVAEPQDAQYILVNPTYYGIAEYCDTLLYDVSELEQVVEVEYNNRILCEIYKIY